MSTHSVQLFLKMQRLQLHQYFRKANIISRSLKTKGQICLMREHVTFLCLPDARLQRMKHCYARHDAKPKKVKLGIIDASIS